MKKFKNSNGGLGDLPAELKEKIIEKNVGALEERQKQVEEKIRKLRERLAELIAQRLSENWGISFSSKEKGGGLISIEEQLAIARNLGLKEMQIDLRSRDDLDSIREKLLAFQEGSPLTNISLHGTTPLIDAETLGVKDGEKLRQAIRLAIECGCDMYTVHPPKISREIFSNLMPEQQKTIIDAYATFFAESIKRAVDSKKSLVVAIENMPTKGGGGGFGQSPEEIKAVVGRVVETLVEQHGFGSFDAERFVGVTFDVDHALIGADPGRQETVIREWLDALGSKIKAFHIYAPSGPGLGFDQKLSQFLKLYKEYGLDVPIYLESKQKPETTRDVFLSGRENLEIQIEAGDERSKMFTSGSWQNNAGREG